MQCASSSTRHTFNCLEASPSSDSCSTSSSTFHNNTNNDVNQTLDTSYTSYTEAATLTSKSNTSPTPTNTARASTIMRTLVCFGQDGHGEVEVSPPENLVMRELHPTDAWQEQKRPGGRTRHRPKEGIRLFHTQPLMMEDDDDDDTALVNVDINAEYLDKYSPTMLRNEKEELCCESETGQQRDASEREDEPLFPEPDPAFLEPAVTPPRASQYSVSRRMPSKKVLAAIDQLEQQLDDMSVSAAAAKTTTHAKPKVSSTTKPARGGGLKAVMSRFLRPAVKAGAESNKPPKANQIKQRESKPSKNDNDELKVSKKRASYTSPRLTKNRFNNRASSKKKKKKQSGDQTLLIPKMINNDSDWFLPDDEERDGSQTMDATDMRVPAAAATTTKKGKKKSGRLFMSRFLRGGRQSKKGQAEQSTAPGPPPLYDLSHDDRTRSLSLEDEGDEEHQQQHHQHQHHQTPIFKNDEELVDHLVKECDKNASLEEGFNCLQERLRSRSFSKLPVDNESDDETPPVFSTSFLEMKPGKSNRQFKAKSSNKSSSARSSPARRDPHNDSIPSFASLEEFLTAGPNDSAHSASLEALMFEQELEKLTTDELGELLDEELEKLVREGFAA